MKVWIPSRQRRFEESIRHLPIKERGRLWLLYHKGIPEGVLNTAIRELGERAERLMGVR